MELIIEKRVPAACSHVPADLLKIVCIVQVKLIENSIIVFIGGHVCVPIVYGKYALHPFDIAFHSFILRISEGIAGHAGRAVGAKPHQAIA